MIQLVSSPSWFYGIDILFDLFSLIVALFISFYAYKTSKVSKFRVHTYFSVFFFFISVSFALKILMSCGIYYDVLKVIKTGIPSFPVQTIPKSEILYNLGQFLYRMLMTSSFAGLYFLVYRENDWKMGILTIYFVFMTTIFSHFFYFVFHLNMIFFLVLICRYYTIMYVKKQRVSRIVASSFFLLLLSQMMFVFMQLSSGVYVIGEAFQLLGYSLLLYNYVSVSRK